MTAPPCAPIVLVHGLLGFARISLGLLKPIRYFPGIEERLTAAGHSVRTASLSLTRGVAARALDLRRFIRREVPDGKFHIFAHSMGGLDARYLISKLDLQERVQSLTTIGTPHRGSSFADWGIRNLRRFLKPLLRLINISSDAFYDLTTESCQRFNEEIRDVPGVRYWSVAGWCEPALLNTILRLPSWVVRNAEGPNDGVVSVKSATYGERCDVWQADHFNLINWPNLTVLSRGLWRDRAEDYVELAQCARSSV